MPRRAISVSMAARSSCLDQIKIDFPVGASLDAKRRIQLDSDYTGKGGVAPQIRIPRTYENMLAVGQGKDVELEAAQDELAKSLTRGTTLPAGGK